MSISEYVKTRHVRCSLRPDEMTRESGIALFDAIGSEEKTMHINPGGHVGTPLFERDAYDAFFARHLGPKD